MLLLRACFLGGDGQNLAEMTESTDKDRLSPLLVMRMLNHKFNTGRYTHNGRCGSDDV